MCMLRPQFNRQSYIGTIEIVEGIIVAVSKSFPAKLRDVFSHQTAYLIILAFYVVGHVIIATAQNAPTLCVRRVISAAGQAGFDIVTEIVVGDLTPLQWRGFFGSMTSFPYLFLLFVGSKIQISLCTSNTGRCWSWGYGMFCTIVVALVSQIIATLFYADKKAREVSELSFASSHLETARAVAANNMQVERAGTRDNLKSLRKLLSDIDATGLRILADAIVLILLLFSLVEDAAGGWSNGSMIAMVVCGFMILGGFIAWEVIWEIMPALNRRIWHNRTFMCAVAIDIF
ncbi:hypothetical protein F5X99DRAFT_410597 [Biscogniauxia marginata]|nr:hypothetical protein F5X99DRAFT_410597 [Biscogniauxia marginata]